MERLLVRYPPQSYDHCDPQYFGHNIGQVRICASALMLALIPNSSDPGDGYLTDEVVLKGTSMKLSFFIQFNIGN